jgi:hypothetical protein
VTPKRNDDEEERRRRIGLRRRGRVRTRHGVGLEVAAEAEREREAETERQLVDDRDVEGDARDGVDVDRKRKPAVAAGAVVGRVVVAPEQRDAARVRLELALGAVVQVAIERRRSVGVADEWHEALGADDEVALVTETQRFVGGLGFFRRAEEERCTDQRCRDEGGLHHGGGP